MTPDEATKPARSTIATRLMALLQHPKMRTMTTQAHLDARLIGLGFTDPCSRCCGGGYFGPRQVQGGVCFTCNGRGTQSPKLTKALETRVIEAVQGGALESYVARRLEIVATKRAAKNAWDDALALYAASEWYQYFKDRDARSGSPLRYAVYDVHHPAYDTGSGLDIKISIGRGTHADAVALIQAKADYVAALARMDRVHRLALSRGLYDAAERDAEQVREIVDSPGRVDRFRLEGALRKRWAEVANRLWLEAEEA